jgi:tetratricopeptide (TPR) repeat protein
LLELQTAADRARDRFENESALDLYNRALALVPKGPKGPLAILQFELLLGRAEIYKRSNELDAYVADAREAEAIARQAKDDHRRTRALIALADRLSWRGQFDEALTAIQTAQELATQCGDPKLLARVALARAMHDANAGDYRSLGERALTALQLCREAGDRLGEGESLGYLANAEQSAGDMDAARRHLTEALALFRSIGDRANEGIALNMLGIASVDHAQARDYFEQALNAARDTGFRGRELTILNNLALLYWRLGLYRKAQAYADAVLVEIRKVDAPIMLATILETQARPMVDAGRLHEARLLFDEGVALSQSVGSSANEGYYRLGLGRVEMAEGRPDAARTQFEQAVNLLEVSTSPGDEITALAFLGAAELEAGDWKSADEHTALAARKLAAAGNVSPEYPFQAVWWWRYQVLCQASKKSKRVQDEAWASLQRAREVMLDSIATLSDEGLKRNFLNKVTINRQIVMEWTREAAAHGLAVQEPVPLPGNLQDQMRRMMEISVRMNEQRDTDALLDFIMDEMVELNGAERSFVVLLDAEGKPDFRIARGVTPEEMEDAQTSARTMLDRVSQTRQAVLETADGTQHAAPLQDRSILAAPLIARGQMMGMLYADNRAIFGRFRETDLDLLSLFANQAATAIDNARLYHGLEQRVAERTAELSTSNASLEQRNAELAIISGAQQGLARELVLQAFIDIVGDKIRATLGGQNCRIAL